MAMLNVEDLKEEFLSCEVCQDEFDEDMLVPRVLPCLHTFCQRCLEGIVRDWTLVCPTCRIKHTVPGDSVKNFPKENTRRSLRDFVRLKRKSHQIPCKDCPDTGVAAYFCKDCQAFMCAECTHAHLRNFMSRNHQIANFEQLRKYGLETFQRQLTCPVPGHEGQQLDYFCTGKSCNRPLCKMCTVLDHDESKGHAIRKISEVYDEQRQNVNELMKRVEDKIAFAKNVMKDTEEELGSLQTKENALKRDIDIEMDAGVKMLEIRRRELKDNLSVRVKEKKSVLQKQKDYLRYYVSLMTSAREFSSHSLVHSMPAEFVQLTKTISGRLAELKATHLDSCPLENSFVSFDKDKMGQDFKSFVLGMGKIRSTAIYAPKTLVEPLEAPLGQETEVLKVFLYDAKGRPQRDSFDAIQVEVKDSKGNIVPSRIQDAKTIDGCYKVICKPTSHGSHKAKIRVLGRLVNEEGFKFTVRSPGEIDKRFGDILCVGFLFDAETAHHERAVSEDGRIMRSDIETLRRVAGLRMRKFRGIARGRRRFPWELENQMALKNRAAKESKAVRGKLVEKVEKEISDASFDKEERAREQREDDDKLPDVGRPAIPRTLFAEKSIWSKKLKKYSGVLGTKFFKGPGKYYWEVNVFYRIHVTLLRNALLFEIGIARMDAVHSSFYVGSQMFAWSFAAERCADHKQVCHKFRHKRQMMMHQPLTADTAGATHHGSYGFLLDTENRTWTIVDLTTTQKKVMYTFQNIDTTEALWPVFGTYNPYSVHVEMALKSGREIHNIPDVLKPDSASSRSKPAIHVRKKKPAPIESKVKHMIQAPLVAQ